MSKLDNVTQKLSVDDIKYVPIGEVVDYEQPGKYIVNSTHYDESYDIPVLTAGQTFVLGYTDEKSGIYNASKENPVIIFDDFTGAFKWVDFKFKVKSSAMKILHVNAKVAWPRYIYYVMSKIGFSSDEHRRLWISKYSAFIIPLPSMKTQQKIACTLDNFIELSDGLDSELLARRSQFSFYSDKLYDSLFENRVESRRIGDYFVAFKGMSGVSSKWGKSGNCQFIDYLNAYNCLKIDTSNTPYATVKTTNQNVLKQGDILLTMASEVPDECAIASVVEDEIREGVFLDDHLFGLRLKSDCDVRMNTTFIMYYMHTMRFRTDVYKKVKGVTRFFVSPSDILNILIPIPSIDVQNEIVRVLNLFETLCNNQSYGLPAEIIARQKQYEFYRDKLLSF